MSVRRRPSWRLRSIRGNDDEDKESSPLQRDDFDAGPSNLDNIEPNLWLGNLTAATDTYVLERRHINHILTVDSCPLPQKITGLPGIKTKFIQGTRLNDIEIFIGFTNAKATFLIKGIYSCSSYSPKLFFLYLGIIFLSWSFCVKSFKPVIKPTSLRF